MDDVQRIRNADIDIIKTNQWLKSAGQKAKTERLITAAQDQDLPTSNNQANIIKMDQTKYVDCANKKLYQLNTVSGCPILNRI